MIKLGIVVFTLALAACSKNVETPIAMLDISEKICAVSHAKPEAMVGRIWFPTFTPEMYIRCSREGRKEKIEYIVRVVK